MPRIDLNRFTRPTSYPVAVGDGSHQGAAQPPVTLPPFKKLSAEESMEALEEMVAKMEAGEPLLFRNRWDREKGEAVRVESRCYWPRADAIWKRARFFQLKDSAGATVPGQYVFDEDDMPLSHEDFYALWRAWYNARFDGELDKKEAAGERTQSESAPFGSDGYGPGAQP